MSARILVVEDDGVVAETLDAYLQRAGYDVRRTRDGREGLALARTGDYALVVLDLMLPGMTGLDVCRELRLVSQVPVLMLTARITEDDRVRGFERGADDCVAKPFSPREVVCRVQALLRRSAPVDGAPPVPDTHGDLAIDRWARTVRVEGRVIDVTRTEFGLLDAVVRAGGRALTREELLGRVFGPDYEGSDRTVDTHLANLRHKLDPQHPQRFIVTLHGVGYRWRGDDA